MKLESQIVSLPLAKRLKELGVKQESYFYWYQSPFARQNDPSLRAGSIKYANYDGPEGEEYSAFTAVELMEISKIVPPVFNFREQRWKWFSPDYEVAILDENETDARAKALIYLIEQGIVKP